jgi:ABC-type antimicrobial peptide transport system permease subunit
VELYNDPGQVGVVVGVVEDMVGRGPEVQERLAIYPPFDAFPFPFSFVNFVVHVRGDPLTFMPEVRRLLAELDPNLPVSNVLTMDDRIQNETASRRFTTTLIVVLAALALILALAGLYGVITHSIGQRSKELGVRIALGASSADVLRLVMRQGLRPAAIGIVVGLLAALWMSRLVAAFLFGISSTDPAIYGAVGLMLGLAAVAACWVPARATLRLEAASVLREE